MDESNLLWRTKQFALRVLKLVDQIPRTDGGRTISMQLARSGTSVGANYRAACKGRSRPEFIAKLGTVEEEADESAYWLELIAEGGLLPAESTRPLWQEADELVRIMAASRRTAMGNEAAEAARRREARKSPIANRNSQIATDD